MLDRKLTEQVLSLPLPERVALAEMLWESLDPGRESDPLIEERAAVGLAEQRSAELSAGVVAGRDHAQVMEAARRALRSA